MLGCVLFVQKGRIDFELKREVCVLCTLPPTHHNPVYPTTHTPHPSPIAIRHTIRTWYNRGSWGTRNEWQIEI
jgi:hypothetical protein